MELNELQRFLKNFFFRILSQVLSALVSIAIFSHLSASLMPEGFGKYNFILTYTSYFIFMTSLGIDIVAIRMMSVDKSRIKEILGSMVSLKLVLTLSVFIMMLLPMLFVPKLNSYGWILVVFSATILPFPFSVQCVFEATKRMEFPSLIAVLSQVLNYVLIKFFVNVPDDLITVGIITISINVFIFTIHNIVFVRQYGVWKLIFDRLMWREFLQKGIVIGFIQIIINMIHYFSILLLGFMKGDVEVGLYSAAYRIMFMIISVMGIFHNLTSPILFENYKLNFSKYKLYFDNYLKFMIYANVATAVGAFFLAEPLLGIFYDLSQYHESVLCFRILTVSILMIGLNSPFNIGLLSIHKEKTLLIIIIIQFTGNIIANILLIPDFGIQGSAMGTIVTEIIGLPVYVYVFKKYVELTMVKHLIIAALAAVPMALVLYFMPAHFMIKAVCGSITMIIFIVLLKGYTIDEILHIKENLFTFKK